jgi:hypothetical protein
VPVPPLYSPVITPHDRVFDRLDRRANGLPDGHCGGWPLDETWLTYREAAERLGISVEAVRALARRKGWSRRSPNRIGDAARILLPSDIDQRARPGVSDSVTDGDRALVNGHPTVAIRGDHPGDRPGDHPLVVEIVGLRDRIADLLEAQRRNDDVVADLRRRLDAEAEERRRLTAILADQRTVTPQPASAPIRRWWRFGR